MSLLNQIIQKTIESDRNVILDLDGNPVDEDKYDYDIIMEMGKREPYGWLNKGLKKEK